MEYKAGQTFIRWDGCFLIKKVLPGKLTIIIKVLSTNELVEKTTSFLPGGSKEISMDFFCQAIQGFYKQFLKMLFN